MWRPETVCNMGDKLLIMAGTIVPPNCVDRGRWVDLEAWTGRSWNTIPTAYREPDEGITDISSFMAEIGDPHCDPRSGGIAGVAHIAPFYGVGVQQFKRAILPGLSFVRWLGDIPISNVNSVQADGVRYQRAVRDKHCANLVQRAGVDPRSLVNSTELSGN